MQLLFHLMQVVPSGEVKVCTMMPGQNLLSSKHSSIVLFFVNVLRVTSIADKLNVDFALIHKERKKANEVNI